LTFFDLFVIKEGFVQSADSRCKHGPYHGHLQGEYIWGRAFNDGYPNLNYWMQIDLNPCDSSLFA